jgi:hypothetical protein
MISDKTYWDFWEHAQHYLYEVCRKNYGLSKNEALSVVRSNSLGLKTLVAK